MPVLQRLQDRQQGRVQDAIQRRTELARAIAAGDESDLDDDEIEEVLSLTGWTLGDLNNDVCRIEGRMTDKVTVARGEELRATRPAIDAEQAEADRVLEEARDAHRRKTRECNQRLQEIKDAVMEAHAAKDRLRETIDPEDAERISRQQFWVGQAQREYDEASGVVQRMKNRLPGATAGGWSKVDEQGGPTSNLGPGFEPRYRAAQERLRDATAALEQAREKLAALTAEAMAN